MGGSTLDDNHRTCRQIAQEVTQRANAYDIVTKKTRRQVITNSVLLPRLIADPDFLIINGTELKRRTARLLAKCNGSVWDDAAADMMRWIDTNDQQSIFQTLTNLDSVYDPHRAVAPFTILYVRNYLTSEERDEIIRFSWLRKGQMIE